MDDVGRVCHSERATDGRRGFAGKDPLHRRKLVFFGEFPAMSVPEGILAALPVETCPFKYVTLIGLGLGPDALRDLAESLLDVLLDCPEFLLECEFH